MIFAPSQHAPLPPSASGSSEETRDWHNLFYINASLKALRKLDLCGVSVILGAPISESETLLGASLVKLAFFCRAEARCVEAGLVY
jgi:hypothetical protein